VAMHVNAIRQDVTVGRSPMPLAIRTRDQGRIRGLLPLRYWQAERP
jgi:hypothetical protein